MHRGYNRHGNADRFRRHWLRRHFGNRLVEFRLDYGHGKFLRRSGSRLRGSWMICRGKSGGALKTAPEFGESLRARAVVALDGNFLQNRGEFRGASVIPRTDGKIQQTLEDRSVAWRTLQNGFQEIDRFLRQPIAGKQIDIG